MSVYWSTIESLGSVGNVFTSEVGVRTTYILPSQTLGLYDYDVVGMVDMLVEAAQVC